MNINERIEKIGKYFKQFNVYDEMAFVVMNFPSKWHSMDYSEICKGFGVVVQKKEDCLYFFIDIKSNIEQLFDSVDEVIKINEQIEKKSNLFKLKTQELKELFTTESLERLNTLVFSFVEPKKTRSKKKKENVIIEEEAEKREINVNNTIDLKEEPVSVVAEEEIGKETMVVSETNVAEVKKTKKNNKINKKEVSLIEFVKEEII